MANQKVVRTGFRIPRRFSLIKVIVHKYAAMFYVKISHFSIQGDHIHLHIRTTRRSNYQSFFRVVAGQIAQRFEKEGLLTLPPKVLTDTPKTPASPRKAKTVTDTPARATDGGKREDKSPKLWMFRPFTRIVMGSRDYQQVQDYIQLNEKEALGEIPYRKERLKGLSSAEWELLWS